MFQIVYVRRALLKFNFFYNMIIDARTAVDDINIALIFFFNRLNSNPFFGLVKQCFSGVQPDRLPVPHRVRHVFRQPHPVVPHI